MYERMMINFNLTYREGLCMYLVKENEGTYPKEFPHPLKVHTPYLEIPLTRGIKLDQNLQTNLHTWRI
jgi:hypothetical protein